MKGKSSKITAIGCVMAMALYASGMNGEAEPEYGQQDSALTAWDAGSRMEMAADMGTDDMKSGLSSDTDTAVWG